MCDCRCVSDSVWVFQTPERRQLCPKKGIFAFRPVSSGFSSGLLWLFRLSASLIITLQVCLCHTHSPGRRKQGQPACARGDGAGQQSRCISAAAHMRAPTVPDLPAPEEPPEGGVTVQTWLLFKGFSREGGLFCRFFTTRRRCRSAGTTWLCRCCLDILC